MPRLSVLALTALIVAISACAPAAPSRSGSDQSGGAKTDSSAEARPSRTMTLVVRYEVTDLAPKIVAGGPSTATKRAFNATLALAGETGAPGPYLAESLPQLNSDSWKVLPESGMETTYRLKPNLTWHDGTPMTADDFVFAYHVYTAPGIAAFISKPQDQIQSVSTPDARTLVIHWKSLYPGAGALVDGDLDPLPRHILEPTLNAYLQDPTNQDTLMSNPFWGSEYIGLGPYKLEQWTPGASIEGVAFDGHVLGRPKIERIVIKPIPDENTAMTNLLAGSADIGTDNALRFEHAVQLQQQWAPTNGGSTLLRPGTRHQMLVQQRSEFIKTTGLPDVRVRRALMHTIDRTSINDALFEGQGLMSEDFVPRGLPYSDDVEKAITHYPFDAKAEEQLMNQAGYTRNAGGYFVSATGEQFHPSVMTDSGAQFDRELNLMQDTWNHMGIEINPILLPAVQVRNNEARNTFNDLYITSTGVNEAALNIFSPNEIGTSNNRWAGNNRNGWYNADVERLWNLFNTTLDRSERNQDIVQISKIVSDEVPSLPIYFNISPIGFTSKLHGPKIGTTESLEFWNMYEWEMD